MRLSLCSSVIFGKLLIISQITITFSRMVPYYLGDTLIMVDSFDSNMPTRNRPSSDDISEVVVDFIDNYSEKSEALPNSDNFDDNQIGSFKVLSDIISAANDNDDSQSKNHVYVPNRVKFAPTIIIKDKNNNIVEHSTSKKAGEVSFNEIVEFINSPPSSLTAGNKDFKSNTKVTFIDSNKKYKKTDTNVNISEHETDDSTSSSKLSVNITDGVTIKNANTNSYLVSTESIDNDKISSTDIKTTNTDSENIDSKLDRNVNNANDAIEVDMNSMSNSIMEEGSNNVRRENSSLTDPIAAVVDGVSSDKFNRPLKIDKIDIKTFANKVDDADEESKPHIQHKDSHTLSDNIIKIDESIGVHDNLKVGSTTVEGVKELPNQRDDTDANVLSDNESHKQNVDTDKVALLGNIEETLNNYFKADNEQTRTETLHKKLQKILNFLKEEETSTNSRTFNYFKGFTEWNLGKSHRSKRDTGQNRVVSRSEGNKQRSQRNYNLSHRHENSIESIELDSLKALSHINPTRELDSNSMEDLSLESKDDEDDDSDDSELDEMESGIPPRRISEGEELPIRAVDYIDYDVDYYDYFDFSNTRVDPGTNDSAVIDEFINSSLNEFGNYSEVDEFGNYVEIIDSGNYTDTTDEYDTNNSTASAFNETIVTSVEDIDNLALLLSKKTCRCGVPISKTNIKRIVKGQDAFINKYPWMVQVAEKRDRISYCGGSIITDLHIVTAAHCVIGYHPKELFVRMGETNATNKVGGRKAFIKSIIVHPKYRARDGTKYDIALIRLRRPIKYTEAVLPVCLSSLHDNEDRNATITGWGSITEGSNGVPVLQEAEVNIMEADTCRNESGYKQHEIPNRVLCARGNGTDSCQGDSGGPLLIEEESQYYLAGITSWGIGCGVEQYPGVYTKVALYIGWIKLKTKDALYCQPDGRNDIRKLSSKYLKKTVEETP